MRPNVKKNHKQGFTLTETLATVLIMSLVTVAIATGITVVRSTFQKIQDKANGQVLLSTTITNLTDSFGYAKSVQSGHVDNPIYLDETNHWVRITQTKDGIAKEYYTEVSRSDTKTVLEKSHVELLVSKSAAAGLVNTFTNYRYDFSKGKFTMNGLAIYGKEDAQIGEDGKVTAKDIPKASLSSHIISSVADSLPGETKLEVQ